MALKIFSTSVVFSIKNTLWSAEITLSATYTKPMMVVVTDGFRHTMATQGIRALKWQFRE